VSARCRRLGDKVLKKKTETRNLNNPHAQPSTKVFPPKIYIASSIICYFFFFLTTPLFSRLFLLSLPLCHLAGIRAKPFKIGTDIFQPLTASLDFLVFNMPHHIEEK